MRMNFVSDLIGNQARRLAPVLVAALLICACASAPKQDAALYRDLGEEAGIAKLVDLLLVEVHGDLRINILFENTDMPYLRERLIEQICQGSGGPCTYTGLSMPEAHSGLGISADDFTAFVEDLNAAMAKAGLAPDVQQRLLALLGPMQPEVVGQ